MKTIQRNLILSILAVAIIAAGTGSAFAYDHDKTGGSTNIINTSRSFNTAVIRAIGTTIKAEPAFLSTSEQAF